MTTNVEGQVTMSPDAYAALLEASKAAKTVVPEEEPTPEPEKVEPTVEPSELEALKAKVAELEGRKPEIRIIDPGMIPGNRTGEMTLSEQVKAKAAELFANDDAGNLYMKSNVTKEQAAEYKRLTEEWINSDEGKAEIVEAHYSGISAPVKIGGV